MSKIIFLASCEKEKKILEKRAYTNSSKSFKIKNIKILNRKIKTFETNKAPRWLLQILHRDFSFRYLKQRIKSRIETIRKLDSVSFVKKLVAKLRSPGPTWHEGCFARFLEKARVFLKRNQVKRSDRSFS